MAENNNGYEALPLLSDTPIYEGQRRDELGFEHTARVLADAAVETPEPLTIGIFGEWGTGKTSTMRLIEQQIKGKDKAVPVWFNAWQYEKEEHLIVPLTATIEQEISEHFDVKKWEGPIAKGAEKLRKALRAIAYGFSIKGKVGIPLISEAEINLSPKDMIERYQDLTREAIVKRSLYFDAFKELSELAQKTDEFENEEDKIETPRIVVLVDDLDRCFPNKAVELLEGIKLVLHQPGFSFVIGINDQIIQRFIKTKYAKEFDIDGSYFDQYLDKIVQVKVPVPEREPESEEMEKYVKSLLTKEVFEDEKTKLAIVPLIAHACKYNPRSIVRMLNRVMITSRISRLEKRDYDPVALLLHITMDESKFKKLRETLDYKLKSEEYDTIGKYLANAIKNFTPNEEKWVANCFKEAESLESPALKKSLEILKSSIHICNVLKLESGQKYLVDEYFRNKQISVSIKTIGDSRKKDNYESLDKNIKTIINKIERNMVEIPAGSFIMGSDKHGDDEQPMHEVSVKSFYMCKYQVTQEEYEVIMGENPSRYEGQNNPVENISWENAKLFCEKISHIIGKGYRLPTEAEWEYACRAGSTEDYCFGNDLEELEHFAWYEENSNRTTHPVGEKKANKYGLYDIHGNVWEWCEDDWHENYVNAPDNGSAWIENPRSYTCVLRGGAWRSSNIQCRSAFREVCEPDFEFRFNGFRVVRLSR